MPIDGVLFRSILLRFYYSALFPYPVLNTISQKTSIVSSDEDLPESFDENNINIGEGHLGGYVQSAPTPAPSGLDISHGDPMTWSPDIWRWAVSTLGIRSLIDVGCGEGHSTRFFRSLGCDAIGVDGSKLARRDSQVPEHHYLHDFNDGAFDPGRPADMVWSCEFVEHVEESFVPNILSTFNHATRFVLMTHGLPGQPGWHHVNCQLPAYWKRKMEKQDFRFHEALTRQARWVADTGIFAHTGLVFVRAAGDRQS